MPGNQKLGVLREYDKILGLGLDGVAEANSVPDDVSSLVQERSSLRDGGRYEEADAIRDSLDRDGYVLQDTPEGTRARPKTPWERRQEEWPTISSPADVRSLVDEADQTDVTVAMVACNYVDDVGRCVRSALRWATDRRVEVVVVDNGSTDGTGRWLEEAAASDPRVRLIHTDHVLGEAAAKNVVLKQSLGRTVVMLDTSVEVTGDVFGPIDDLLADDTIGVVGPSASERTTSITSTTARATPGTWTPCRHTASPCGASASRTWA